MSEQRPTPTDDEMRRANEWYMATYPNSAKFMPNASAYRPIRDAYAAALAKCRVDADKIRADERERCAKIVENLDDFPDLHAGQMRFGLRCGLEDREIECPYAAAEYGFEDASERCCEWAKNTAAAIRGGGQ